MVARRQEVVHVKWPHLRPGGSGTHAGPDTRERAPSRFHALVPAGPLGCTPHSLAGAQPQTTRQVYCHLPRPDASRPSQGLLCLNNTAECLLKWAVAQLRAAVGTDCGANASCCSRHQCRWGRLLEQAVLHMGPASGSQADRATQRMWAMCDIQQWLFSAGCPSTRPFHQDAMQSCTACQTCS